MAIRGWETYEDTMMLDSEHAPGGVIVYYADGDEEIIHVNQYVIDLFECNSAEEFMEHTGGSFRGFVHNEDVESAEDSIWGQVIEQDNLDHIFYRIKTKTGRLVNIDDYGRLVRTVGERPVFHVFIIEMKAVGYIDWLTGLPAMMRFYHLARMGATTIRKRGERPVAIALDLVGLKSFNTKYTREGGDQLLCAFAELLRKHFGTEACSRFGEDHYYAFAGEKGIEDKIESLFEDFRHANDGKVLPVRVGMYVCHEEDDIVAVGFDRAKFACDLDRKTWHSHFEWFNEDMRTEAQLRIHVLEHIDRAIAEGWIQPYYQGIVRAATGLVCGEEALARWIDPVFGFLQPGLFIPVLEESELLQKLDMHMVDCVLRDFKIKRESGIPIVPVSVNISLRDLGQIDIAKEISKRVDEAGISHDLLRIEFTESAASADTEFFQKQVERLHAAGFEVWLDDFGSGYSSLNMLQYYDFDLIKLDMEFVKDIGNVKAREIVLGVIHAANKLGVRTLTEGVETEEQALFLEEAGCDLIQGFYYTKPNPLEYVIATARDDSRMPRENLNEFEFWNDIDLVDLSNPLSHEEEQAEDGTQLSEFPAGVMEKRGDTWRLVRSNMPYREFLENGGVIPLSESNLKAIVFEDGVDREYAEAAERSKLSHNWERVSGRLEYGTGLQFYTKLITSSEEAEAFVLASVPTMLGTALGTYGDVPVAYAVLRAIYDESGDSLLDAEYIYANTVYCEWCQYDQAMLPGKTFLELTEEPDRDWFSYFYRAVANNEQVHDVLFSPEVGHWLSFSVAPAKVDNCFTYAFTLADDEHRERQEMRVGLDTSELIIKITNLFNSEGDFNETMQRALEMISLAIRPDRLYIFERGATSTSGTYEWCSNNVDSRFDALQNIDNRDFEAWVEIVKSSSTVIIPDVSEFKHGNYELYKKFASQGIRNIIAAPLYHGKELIGFIVADNYELEEAFDVRRLIETIAPFISVKITNNRLLNELARLGTHDALTSLHNRHGVDYEIKKHMMNHPEESFVVALIDVDDFKTMNDMYGHFVGDEALRLVSRTIKEMCPENAIVGRNGGDEFIVLLFGDDVACADDLFNRLTSTLLSFERNGNCYRTFISIGYVTCPDQAANLKDAYTKADIALYAVKLSGKSHAKRYANEFEAKYRSLLGFSSRDLADNIPGGIMVHKASDDHEILFANDELITMLDCDDPQDFMDYTRGTIAGLMHPDDLERVEATLERQALEAAPGSKGFADYRIVTKHGQTKRIAANSRLVETDEAGLVFYIILVDRDERTL